jgi:three-Cys-motif partner protein
MSRPHDLDAHVRRVLAREQEWLAASREPRDQMHLFDMAPTVVPGRRYETPAGLVVDTEEMLFARAISLHSIEKAFLARTYADIVGVAIGGRWKLWWIELFAGPGRLYVRDTGDFIAGSPLEALAIRRPFHGYVFADLDRACTESLRRRIGEHSSVHILRGDANGAELLDKIVSLVPKSALVVLYGDQAGLDLHWPTIKFFIDRYKHLDLLLNLPTEGTVRALAAGYDEKAAKMLDHPAPARLLQTGTPKGASVRDWYRRHLTAAGFDQIEGATIRIRGSSRDLYDLLLASRNPLAPKFFSESIASFERNRRLAAS